MKVLVFPKDPNPYQSLLYEGLSDHVQVQYLDVPVRNKWETLVFFPRLVYGLVLGRLTGHRILHVHWLYVLGLRRELIFSRHVGYIYSILFLMLSKALRYKTVWTVHNVLPHEQLTINDLKIRKRLARQASAKIVHSKSAIEEMERLGIDASNSSVIPHGNYEKVYPNTITAEQARERLGIPQDAKVALFFGRIEKYKNVPELINVFAKVASDNNKVHLIIAGTCRDKSVGLSLDKLNKQIKARVHFYNRFINDDEVQLFFNAADVAVFPFSEITTSGSVILATTFGKPIVAPRIGSMEELPVRLGALYDSDKIGSLHDALKRVISATANERMLMAKASAAYSKTLSWDKIAAKTYGVYEEVLNRDRAANM